MAPWVIHVSMAFRVGASSMPAGGMMPPEAPEILAERQRINAALSDLEAALRAAGLEPESAIEPGSTGAGSLMLVDPDGNPILIDQFF